MSPGRQLLIYRMGWLVVTLCVLRKVEKQKKLQQVKLLATGH